MVGLVNLAMLPAGSRNVTSFIWIQEESQCQSSHRGCIHAGMSASASCLNVSVHLQVLHVDTIT